MKTITPILLLLALSFSSIAQTQKIAVFCRLFDNGKADYGNLVALLPLVVTDSVKNSLLVDPRKDYHMNNLSDAYMLMTMNGWKLVAPNVDINGYGGGVSSGTYFLLTKDIYTDDKGKAIFMQRLKTVYGD
ncbi:MAG TPA: hypothetical protein VGM41_01115 [Chitinophagaceae bacterium]|jgi:hypothetical protein